ncbi:MAG TPA: SufD family Fe-S cluster assembly protein, partial [Erythrobacter sp.]|nr:SufD family Fe-S cluster assembly protein [Erythrobacter sp.]
MSEAATLPTTRDEDWRYADAGYLAQADAATLAHWRRLDVPAGASRSECATYLAAPQAGGSVDRLRVHVGQGGRFEAFVVIAGGPYLRCEIE